MKKIINKIPNGLLVSYREGNIVYSSYGLISNLNQQNRYGWTTSKSAQEVILTRRSQPEFFMSIDDNTLVLNRIEVIDEEESITFDYKEEARYIYNPEYKELDIEFENIGVLYQLNDAVSIDKKRYEIFDSAFNTQSLYTFVYKMLLSDNFYEELLKKDIMFFNAIKLFSLYLNKANKAIKLLLQNDMISEIKYLLSEGVVYDLYGYEINARTIKLAKIIDTLDVSGIIISSRLLARFNFNEIETLMKVANYFKFSNIHFWETLLELDVNLSEFSNYLVKSLFLNNNLDYKISVSKSVLYFIGMFKDYLNMKRPDDPVYPDNLKEAHDLAHHYFIRISKEKDKEEKDKAFAERINNDYYKNLAWEDENYKVVIPQSPEDLIEEGRKMNHCVGGYVTNVISNRCKIVFLRKDDNPYITIEIRGNEIVQAKKKNNQLPCGEEELLIEKWAKEKSLVVGCY